MIPLFVFAFGAFFAVMLWELECNVERDAEERAPYEALGRLDPTNLCSFYQWFLYVVGNLVGLGNPLTNVGPSTGNAMSETLDLLICVWSLGIAGAVIGIAGSMSFMDSFTHTIEMGRNESMQLKKMNKKVVRTLQVALSEVALEGSDVRLERLMTVRAWRQRLAPTRRMRLRSNRSRGPA